MFARGRSTARRQDKARTCRLVLMVDVALVRNAGLACRRERHQCGAGAAAWILSAASARSRRRRCTAEEGLCSVVVWSLAFSSCPSLSNLPFIWVLRGVRRTRQRRRRKHIQTLANSKSPRGGSGDSSLRTAQRTIHQAAAAAPARCFYQRRMATRARDSIGPRPAPAHRRHRVLRPLIIISNKNNSMISEPKNAAAAAG